jgi:prepilin-type N-terminal cleavage/methylation domain-containing protein
VVGVGAERAQETAVLTRRHPRGFSLTEMMLVVSIIGILVQIVLNEFKSQIMYAKRTEAIVGLNAMWKAQKEHLARTGHYTGTFDDLDFGITGGKQLAPGVYKGSRYTYQLSQPWGEDSFYCIATAQLDADPWPDIIEIFEQTAEGS